MQAIRFGDHIGIRYRIGSHADPFEIYDIVSDPKQTKDLAAEMPDLHAKMRDGVLRMRMPESTAPRPYDSELVPAISVESTLGIGWSAHESNAPWLARPGRIWMPLEKGVSVQVEEIGIPECRFHRFPRVPGNTLRWRIHLPHAGGSNRPAQNSRGHGD